MLRALNANPDIPNLDEFPRAHQVTFRYYVGMLSFLNEEYAKVRSILVLRVLFDLTLLQAEEELTLAFYHCHSAALGNLRCAEMSTPQLAELMGIKSNHDLPTSLANIAGTHALF